MLRRPVLSGCAANKALCFFFPLDSGPNSPNVAHLFQFEFKIRGSDLTGIRAAGRGGGLLRGGLLRGGLLRGELLRGGLLRGELLRGELLRGGLLRGGLLRGELLRGGLLRGAVAFGRGEVGGAAANPRAFEKSSTDSLEDWEDKPAVVVISAGTKAS